MENIIIPNKYMETFDKLNNGRNTTRIWRELSIWPDWAPDQQIAAGANDFWKLSELLNTVDGLNGEPYKSTITLDNAVRAYTPNKLKENNPERMSKLASGHFRVIDDKNFDAEVSRFAAWALVKEIGKSKPTIFHQEYFMTPNPNTSIIDLYRLTNQAERIGLRSDVRKYQKQLNGIMNKLHAHNQHYAELNREMVKWLFGNLNAGDIREEYRLHENKPLADFMNAHLLAAYGTAIRDTVSPQQLVEIVMKANALGAHFDISNAKYEDTIEVDPEEVMQLAVEDYRTLGRSRTRKELVEAGALDGLFDGVELPGQ